ncbi:MAG: hypothetical protein V4622_06325 [Bacteroidota bacterium]
MKAVKYILILTIITSTFIGCKKGENDPFLSLKSRKARISGEWTMSSAESKSTDESGTMTSTYDGATQTNTFTPISGTNVISTTKITSDFTIDKNGTFKTVSTTTSTSGSTTVITTEGNWVFAGKSKNADLKKKEAILLSITSQTETGELGLSQTGTFMNDGILIIDRLKNKEMIIKYDESRDYVNNTNSNLNEKETRIGSMTFTQK